jgi:hypothetical protein
MVHSGSPFVHTVLEECSDEGDTISVGGVSSGFPGPLGCNVVTPTIPITTTPPQENTSALLTIPIVQLRATAPQPGTGLLLEQHQAYQE